MFNKNNIDDIKLPDNFDSKVDNIVNKGFKQRNSKNSKGKKVAMAAGLTLTLTSGLMVANSEYVEAAINKIIEIVSARTYAINLGSGAEVFTNKYEYEHMGVKITLDVDTSIEGFIKIEEVIDSRGIKAEDWKLTGDNFNIEKMGYVGTEFIEKDTQVAIFEKIYRGEDISADIKMIEEHPEESDHNKEHLLSVINSTKEAYDWGVSDDDFKLKGTNSWIDYKINGEAITNDVWFESYDEGRSLQEYAKYVHLIKIPEHLQKKSNLTLTGELTNCSIMSNYALETGEPQDITIELKKTREESNVKYIEVNQSFVSESIGEVSIKEVVVHPNILEIIFETTAFDSDMNKDYYIDNFIIEIDGEINSLELPDTQSSEINNNDNSNENDEDKALWSRKYQGEITGDTIKIMPVLKSAKDGKVIPQDSDVVKSIKPIILNLK